MYLDEHLLRVQKIGCVNNELIRANADKRRQGMEADQECAADLFRPRAVPRRHGVSSTRRRSSLHRHRVDATAAGPEEASAATGAPFYCRRAPTRLGASFTEPVWHNSAQLVARSQLVLHLTNTTDGTFVVFCNELIISFLLTLMHCVGAAGHS